MANIGFISTRFFGADGVSLESEKWARMLQENGHEMVEENYRLAARYYSYAVLRRRMQTLVMNVMGLD